MRRCRIPRFEQHPSFLRRRLRYELTPIVSYKKLWKLLIDKDMMKKDLKEKAHISWTSITKMSKGEDVSNVFFSIAKFDMRFNTKPKDTIIIYCYWLLIKNDAPSRYEKERFKSLQAYHF